MEKADFFTLFFSCSQPEPSQAGCTLFLQNQETHNLPGRSSLPDTCAAPGSPLVLQFWENCLSYLKLKYFVPTENLSVSWPALVWCNCGYWLCPCHDVIVVLSCISSSLLLLRVESSFWHKLSLDHQVLLKNSTVWHSSVPRDWYYTLSLLGVNHSRKHQEIQIEYSVCKIICL